MKKISELFAKLRADVKGKHPHLDELQHNVLTGQYRAKIPDISLNTDWIERGQLEATLRRQIYLIDLQNWRDDLTNRTKLQEYLTDPSRSWTIGSCRVHSEIDIVTTDGNFHKLPVFAPGNSREGFANIDNFGDIKKSLHRMMTAWIYIRPREISDVWRCATFLHEASGNCFHLENIPVSQFSGDLDRFVETVASFVHDDWVTKMTKED